MTPIKEKIAISEDRFAGLGLLSTGVIVINAKARIIYANQSAESLCGVSARLLQDQDCSRLIDGVSNWLDLHAKDPKSTFSVQSQLTELHRPPFAPLQVYVTAHPIFDREMEIVLEITEAQEHLRQSRDEQLLGLTEASRQLLRNLAHEVKNPLGGIRGAAQLLGDELVNPEQKEYTEIVISEADRLQKLVDRLLEPYRHPHQPTSINIHEVLERTRALVEAEFPKGLRIHRDYDASVPEIIGDRGQLTQVFLNLIRNAAEALQQRLLEGNAEITIRTRVARQVNIGRIRHRLALNVHVIDNGPGISPEICDSIFYPLVSGREGGSGLGLSLVQTFIEQHAGTIEVTSQPGQTDFSILLPLPL